MTIIYSNQTAAIGVVPSPEQTPDQPIYHPSERSDVTSANLELFKTPKFRDLVANRLSGLVQIPTVTYDEMGLVGEDSRWEVFGALPKYFEETFLRVYHALEVITINKYAFLYTWKGSDSSLKPVVFMAHTDVVPAPEETSNRWTYPPFSGHYDGEHIWGRGSEDDKSNVIAILSAIDSLLGAGFEPSRTVVFAVGFDEEGGAPGGYGARCLAEHLIEAYGEDGVELIFDEGIPGIEEHFATEFALPATAEKGYLDVAVTIDTAGGHSSTPPDHTAIGYLARVIQAIEDNPFQSRLTAANPTLTYLKIIAIHAKDIPLGLRKAILDPRSADKVLKYMDSSLDLRALVRTSTAVDVVQGGEKANALPETAHIIVNHRIAVEESVQIVQDYYVHILSPLAKKWNFGLQGFGQEAAGNHNGTITLAGHDALEPSPTSDPQDQRFDWLTGTIRGVFGTDMIVAPVLLTGNTDTKFYWKLSSQIYRWSPWRASLDPRGSMMHTVDERMPVEGLLEMTGCKELLAEKIKAGSVHEFRVFLGFHPVASPTFPFQEKAGTQKSQPFNSNIYSLTSFPTTYNRGVPQYRKMVRCRSVRENCYILSVSNNMLLVSGIQSLTALDISAPFDHDDSLFPDDKNSIKAMVSKSTANNPSHRSNGSPSIGLMSTKVPRTDWKYDQSLIRASIKSCFG